MLREADPAFSRLLDERGIDARELREELLGACEQDGIQGFLPGRSMCTDNAAMIAAAGWHRLRSDGPTSLDVGATPNLRLPFID